MRPMAGRTARWRSDRPGVSKAMSVMAASTFPSVQALPASEEKSRLTERGIRSWLCVPMWYAGNRVGLLGFDAVAAEKRWADDDIALLRTIGEIFASALGREQAEREKQTLEIAVAACPAHGGAGHAGGRHRA